jgi:hypothetical protein
MRTCKFALAALLLGAAGACSARVPVIRLMPFMGEGGGHAGAVAQQAVPAVLQSAAGPEQRRQSAGSFAAEAASALSAPAGGAAIMPPTARTRYGALVAARPLPAFGPVLLLVLGCLVYLGRGRHHGFSLRPAHSLLERSVDAPAHS